METEKRIGDFRVNRKVAWGISFPQRLHTRFSVRKASGDPFGASFLHSVTIEGSALQLELFHTLQEALHRHGILVSKPAICDRPRPCSARLLVEPLVGFDHDRLDLAEKARFTRGEVGEVLLRHPGQEPLQPGGGFYETAPPAPAGGARSTSYTLGFSTQMNGRLR